MTQWRLLIGGLGLCISTCTSAGATTAVAECQEGDREIRPVSREQPYYPHSAMMFCVAGSVQTQFTVDTQGLARDVRIIESEPVGVFDAAATEAMSRWLFVPACRSGELAERKAVQTIEFEIPDSRRAVCERRLDAVNTETSRLLGDLGARYAILADVHLERAPIQRFADAIEQPMSGYSGDLAAVAEYHQRTLEDIHASYYDANPGIHFSRVMRQLMPAGLAEDAQLEQVQTAMDEYRETLRQAIAERQASRHALKSGYEALKQETELPEDTLSMLVSPFLGNVEAPVDEVVAIMLEPLEPLQEIVDLLVLNRDDWRIKDRVLVFDDPQDQATWADAMLVIAERRRETHNHRNSWLETFQDYSD